MRALYIALALLPLGASACDPDEMDRAMSEICTAGNDAAAEIVQAALPAARNDEPAQMQARLDQARHACINGDPAVAAREAVRLARFAAGIEARSLGKGIAP